MKDTKKILRTAIFNALAPLSYNGSAVPVYDEKAPNANSSSRFVILSTQQETYTEGNDTVFITESAIDLEIYDKTKFEVSKDAIDGIYEAMMQILLPTPQTIGLTVPAGFQFLNAKRESCFTQAIAISDTESILLSRVKLVFTIIEK